MEKEKAFIYIKPQTRTSQDLTRYLNYNNLYKINKKLNIRLYIMAVKSTDVWNKLNSRGIENLPALEFRNKIYYGVNQIISVFEPTNEEEVDNDGNNNYSFEDIQRRILLSGTDIEKSKNKEGREITQIKVSENVDDSHDDTAYDELSPSQITERIQKMNMLRTKQLKDPVKENYSKKTNYHNTKRNKNTSNNNTNYSGLNEEALLQKGGDKSVMNESDLEEYMREAVTKGFQ